MEINGKNVLDIAYGRRILSSYYAKNFGARVIGIDLNPDVIKSSVTRAKREGVNDFTEFRVADSLTLPFGDQLFDAVVNGCAVGPDRESTEMRR
ncbi:MAG: class I SAM-dependent methyltransferase [Chloroflexi bacterium]|nr:class I SAM-dependent methyltransferase [Chloroflexota bacterium]